MGLIVRCGACGGTGVARSRAAPEAERAPAASMPDPAAALRRRQEALGAARDHPGPEDYSALPGAELFAACERIDRRYLAELPNTIVGRTTAETAGKLEAIAADYRRLAAEGRRAALDRAALERKIADATKALAGARDNLGENSSAARAYAEARAAYVRLGAEWDARSCDASLARLRLRASGGDRARGGLDPRLGAAGPPLEPAERRPSST